MRGRQGEDPTTTSETRMKGGCGVEGQGEEVEADQFRDGRNLDRVLAQGPRRFSSPAEKPDPEPTWTSRDPHFLSETQRSSRSKKKSSWYLHLVDALVQLASRHPSLPLVSPPPVSYPVAHFGVQRNERLLGPLFAREAQDDVESDDAEQLELEGRAEVHQVEEELDRDRREHQDVCREARQDRQASHERVWTRRSDVRRLPDEAEMQRRAHSSCRSVACTVVRR